MQDLISAAQQRILVVSPHLDDAVFSCGGLIAGAQEATVVTLFAGLPEQADTRQTEWDGTCGFAHAREAIERRRGEDKRAMAILQAHPVWLDFCDHQYGASPGVSELAAALLEVIERTAPDAVLIPAGLFHSDHELAHRAAMLARRDRGQGEWLMYEDALYRHLDGVMQRRLLALFNERIAATPVPIDTQSHLGAKVEAAQCYVSQLKGLSAPGRPGYADLVIPERYWRLGALQDTAT
jgi:LmbE family N-acetylglucosaminyl deacetylase